MCLLFIIEDLENIKKQLNKLIDNIRKSLTIEHSKEYYSISTTRQLGWVDQIFKSLSEISAELETVKKKLGILTSTDSGHSQSEALVTNFRAMTEQVSPGILESRL